MTLVYRIVFAIDRVLGLLKLFVSTLSWIAFYGELFSGSVPTGHTLRLCHSGHFVYW